jgi:hypothetical protein
MGRRRDALPSAASVTEQTIRDERGSRATGGESRGAAGARTPAPARLSAPIAWLIGGAGIALLGLIVARAANTRPGFDPYGWLVWGHQTLIGNLNTNAAPSWKPLPFLFTVPYAFAGHYQLWLWMITSVAVSLSASLFAARIAYRLTDPPADRRWAAVFAAAFAAVTVLIIDRYWHFILSDQSDPMIAALVLGAIDCHLSERPRWAFALGILACLGRPEIWPLTAVYAIWAWRARPSIRVFLIAGFAVLLVMWFGIPWISSRSPFVAADNALHSGRRLHSNLVFGTIGRFVHLQPVGLLVAAVLSVGLAIWRRDRATLLLAGVVGLWVAVEIAMVLHGWPGVPRYMFGAAGVLAVIAAIGLGRVLAQPASLSSPVGLAGIAAVAALVLSVIPWTITQARLEHRDLTEQRLRTDTINKLTAQIAALGGPARFLRCGEPLTRLQYQSVVAWGLRRNVAAVGFKYGPAIASTRPIVLFTPYPQPGGGWQIQALHQRLPACRLLPS